MARTKTTIPTLTWISFYHMLLLSFSVTVQLIPGHEPFKAIPIYQLLLAQATCFEIFFVLAFLRAVPNRDTELEFEFFSLMLGNMIMASLMAGMVDYIMAVFAFTFWFVAIMIGTYLFMSQPDQAANSATVLVNRLKDETNALLKTVDDLDKWYANP
ncbi:hypothetical protein TSUD_274770 [Trifolium subterraneum]|uniref:Uncharacterized protein n=1 Tax=Trifolium subterraneum TaxID=3900 RepID=A0A2Z6NH83_TRISU|nr:hypothetical protein TSUD_274770 [Trifolium subterraneum]